ncbi:MAG TPA: hypothetical protein DEP53_08685 [Bacteroidetes bacterium]|nr:hypothetical protein [Bacteroidota bacterium]
MLKLYVTKIAKNEHIARNMFVVVTYEGVRSVYKMTWLTGSRSRMMFLEFQPIRDSKRTTSLLFSAFARRGFLERLSSL